MAGITIVYVLSGSAGLSFAVVNPAASPISPPAGIAVAALLVAGLRVWPAVAAGAFITNLLALEAPGTAAVIAAGDTLAAVVAAALTIRLARGARAFDRAPDVFRFAFVAAVAAPALAATIGTVTLRLWHDALPAETWSIWLTLWLGDATSVALLSPFCVLATVKQTGRQAGRLETGMLAAALALVLYAVFGVPADLQRGIPRSVLMLPLMLWSAFRIDSRTTAALGVGMAVVAIYRVLQQYGPFELGPPAVSLLIAQSLVSVISLLMLAVAAETAVRRRVEAEMRHLNEALERRVDERTAQLSRTLDRLVEAQAVAQIGSFEWDVETGVWRWSEELCRIFGVAVMPDRDASYLQLIHPGDRERAERELTGAVHTGMPFTFEHRIVKPDGEERVIHTRGRVERADTGHVRRVLGIGHDITERIRAEAARAQLIEEQAKLREAEQVNRAKDAFLATLSHELRTPLNAALGWTHILRESIRADPHEVRIVDAIYRNLHLQARLVNDILDISRIAKGELPLEWDDVELRVVFEAAVDMLREAASGKGLVVDLRCSGAPVVAGDSRRLQQVAWNLLSNAIKFCSEGGRITLSIVDDHDSVECTVEDEGPGITPAFLPHVFEQFRQADASVTREYGGLGLGLAIAREIIAMHDGTIVAGNRAAGGAVFVVRLPKRRAGASRHPMAARADVTAKAPPAPT